MLKLAIDNQRLVPVRLIPVMAKWTLQPAEWTRILANRKSFHHIHIPSLHLQPNGTVKPMSTKCWKPIINNLDSLTDSLKPNQTTYNENNALWKEKSLKSLPANSFVWLRDLEASWSTIYTERNLAPPHERPNDRKLNDQIFLSTDMWQLIYEGFEPAIPTPQLSEKQPCGITTSFEILHNHLIHDPYYGVLSSATDTIVNSICQDNKNNFLYEGLHTYRVSSLPCKGITNKQRELIYLWCGPMGLCAYQDGQPLDWQWEDFLKNWTQDFQIKLDELQSFLRQHSLPLPVALFSNEVDNTDRKVALSKEKFDRDFQSFAVMLFPALKDELAETKRIQPESMEAQQQKIIKIEEIERRIADINNGNYKNHLETHYKEKQQLKRNTASVKREARKLVTQARYNSWNKEYRKLKKLHPNKSYVWHAKQIEKMDIAKDCSYHTIRRNMK